MQGRGGKGVLTIQYDRRRGTLVGALIVDLDDELYAITSSGGVIRTPAREVRKARRQTMGVRLMNLGETATLLAIARNAEDDARRPAAARPGELPEPHTRKRPGEPHPVSQTTRTATPLKRGHGTRPRRAVGRDGSGGPAADGVSGSRRLGRRQGGPRMRHGLGRRLAGARSDRGGGGRAAASPAAEPSARAVERPPAEAVDPAAMTSPPCR